MKPIVFSILLLSSLLVSCFNNDKRVENEFILSPTKKYFVKIDVTNGNTDKGNIRVKLFDSDKKPISELDTKAGDFSKWAVGWTQTGDTLVMRSRDIGNLAWKISASNFEVVQMNKGLNEIAEAIFKSKYQ